MKGSLPRDSWPEPLRVRVGVRGVFVGGCVARGVGSSFRAKAHAHYAGEHKGWLCFRRADRLECMPLVLHELAHLITPGGHTDAWRRTLLNIGGTLDPVPADGSILRSYHRRAPRVDADGAEGTGRLDGATPPALR